MVDVCAYTLNLAEKNTRPLLLAGQLYDPDDKYRALQAALAAMGMVGQTGSSRKRCASDLSAREKRQITSTLDNLKTMFETRQIDNNIPFAEYLKLAMARFDLPGRPFINMAQAMKYELQNDRIDCLDSLYEYLNGPVVAPAAIFVYLSACQYDDLGQLTCPILDIYNCARPLGRFMGLTSILAGFKDDFGAGPRPLIYFDTETSNKFFVEEHDMGKAVRSGKPILKLTKMAQYYFNRLSEFQKESLNCLEKIVSGLPRDGRAAMYFLYQYYARLAEKISENSYDITSREFALNDQDYEAVISATADCTGCDMDDLYPIREALGPAKV